MKEKKKDFLKCGQVDCKYSYDNQSGCYFWSVYALEKKSCKGYNEFIKKLKSKDK